MLSWRVRGNNCRVVVGNSSSQSSGSSSSPSPALFFSRALFSTRLKQIVRRRRVAEVFPADANVSIIFSSNNIPALSFLSLALSPANKDTNPAGRPPRERDIFPARLFKYVICLRGSFITGPSVSKLIKGKEGKVFFLAAHQLVGERTHTTLDRDDLITTKKRKTTRIRNCNGINQPDGCSDRNGPGSERADRRDCNVTPTIDKFVN